MLIEVPIRSGDANNVFCAKAKRSERKEQRGQDAYAYAKYIEKC